VFRAHKTDGSIVLSVNDMVQEEYLARPDSFSRVENTKNSLDALCTEVRYGLEQAIVDYERLARSGAASNGQAAVVLVGAIHDGEVAVREFEGTEEQLYIVQDLLRLLERAGRFEQWTQLYLKALYQYPTQHVVSDLAGKAVELSSQSGQAKQVLEALRYLAGLPVDFAGRAEVEAALSSALPRPAQVQRGSETGGAPSSSHLALVKQSPLSPTFASVGR
jgi:hypothetical protein